MKLTVVRGSAKEDKKNMGDFTKRTMENMLQKEEQLRSKKPSITRPFSHGASPFQPWQPSWMKSLGNVEASNNITMKTTNPSHALKMNSINVGGSSSGAAGGDNGARTVEPQLGSGTNTQPDMDPKRLKRIMANRASAQRSRIRKNEYMAKLVEEEKSCQARVFSLRPQIEAEMNQKRLLQIEQHQLKFQMAIREKERVLQEVEIAKNRAEIKRLEELQRKLIANTKVEMMNLRIAMQHISNSNLDPPPGFERINYPNPNQAQSEVGTSRLQTNTSQQPQNQRQVWMGNWNNGKKSTPDFNIVKSEPADY